MKVDPLDPVPKRPMNPEQDPVLWVRETLNPWGPGPMGP
jgi:hypothetical protein